VPRAKYIYRICSINDVLYNTGLMGAPSEELDGMEAWESLYNKSQGEWLRFENSTERSYFGYSRISWWTDSNFQEDVILSALKAGLFINWLGEFSILLRCRSTELTTNSLCFVPTVVDAFCQLVFHPTEDMMKPTTGIAIDLSQSGLLTTGVCEFVLRPVELQHLEFLPVRITRRMKRQSFKNHSDRNPEQLTRLIAYYQTL